LVIGYWLLVIGYWLLVIGYWLLVIGYWLLVIVDFRQNWKKMQEKIRILYVVSRIA